MSDRDALIVDAFFDGFTMQELADHHGLTRSRIHQILSAHPDYEVHPPHWVNPLVCVCPEPDADPARNFGECSVCRRKPLALMAVPA